MHTIKRKQEVQQVLPPTDQTASINEEHWRENDRFTPLSEDLRSGNNLTDNVLIIYLHMLFFMWFLRLRPLY